MKRNWIREPGNTASQDTLREPEPFFYRKQDWNLRKPVMLLSSAGGCSKAEGTVLSSTHAEEGRPKLQHWSLRPGSQSSAGLPGSPNRRQLCASTATNTSLLLGGKGITCVTSTRLAHSSLSIAKKTLEKHKRQTLRSQKIKIISVIDLAWIELTRITHIKFFCPSQEEVLV